jgi:hypothetical protein
MGWGCSLQCPHYLQNASSNHSCHNTHDAIWRSLSGCKKQLTGSLTMQDIYITEIKVHTIYHEIFQLRMDVYDWSWGSSVMPDYRLDGRRSSPRQSQRIFPLTSVSRPAEAHTSSLPMGTGGPFPRGKPRPERDADHSPPSSAEVKNEELYLLSTLASEWR